MFRKSKKVDINLLISFGMKRQKNIVVRGVSRCLYRRRRLKVEGGFNDNRECTNKKLD